jgi:hypothetical protein
MATYSPSASFQELPSPLQAIISPDTQEVRRHLSAGRVSSKLYFARYFPLIATESANFSNYLGRKQQNLPFSQV